MPANVKTMFYVGDNVPWHGLGVQLDSPPTIQIGLEASGLDHMVGLKPLFTAEGIKVTHQATYRETDGKILGVVGPKYHVLQNVDAFKWFQPFIDSGECSLHTAGALDEGRKIWVLAQINRDPSQIVPGDDIAKFVMLSNSHDGTMATRVGFTPIRIVCANTLAMAHNDKASKILRVRHSSQAKTNLDAIREIMNTANQEFEATAQQYRFLASRKISVADLNKYVKIVLGVKDEEISTRTKNLMGEIIAKCEEGLQNDLMGIRDTWYSAYLGVNEWLNYNRGRNTDSRMTSLWFGPNYTANRDALVTAMELATAA